MRVDIGYYRDIASGVREPGNSLGTFWTSPGAATDSEIPMTYVVQEGDRLVRAGVAMGGGGTTNYTAKVALYGYETGSSSPVLMRLTDPVMLETGGVNHNRYVTLDVDVDLSAFVGMSVQPSGGAFVQAGSRIFWPNDKAAHWYGSTQLFPDNLPATGTLRTQFPGYFVTIESPAPEGYTDIVVGDDPLYGDDRSIVKDFTGTPPAPGDQLRYANLTAGGAEIVVRPDLTYTGDYGGNPVPQQDTVEVAYWSGTEWQWYTVTAVFSDNPPEEAPVNTVLPEITGVATVRQELTATNGSWTGSPTGFTYRWLVDGVDTGITSNTFTPVDDSYQKLVTVEVTATNAFGSTSATSLAVGPLGGFAPIIQPFTIQGVPRVGSVLRFNLTVDAVPSAIVTTNWEDATTGEILAVNTNTYRLRSEDLGDMIKVDVVAENEEGQTYYESVSVGPVEDAAPVEDSDFIYLDWIALNYPKGDADA